LGFRGLGLSQQIRLAEDTIENQKAEPAPNTSGISYRQKDVYFANVKVQTYAKEPFILSRLYDNANKDLLLDKTFSAATTKITASLLAEQVTQSAQLFVAQYNAQNELIGASLSAPATLNAPAPANAADIRALEANLTVNANATRVKAFIWDGADAAKPLFDVVELTRGN
jgi:hypothetical protein